MRILFLASDLSAFGGIQRYNRNFLAALRGLGNEVAAVEQKGTGLGAKAGFVLRFWIETVRFAPEVTVCTHVNFSPLSYAAKLLLGRPYTVTVYGIEVSPIRSAAHRRALRAASTIVKLFDATAEEVVRQLPEVRERIVTIPNSVDGTRFSIKGRPQNLVARFHLEKMKVALTACRLSSVERDLKGYDRVIRAMPEVLRAVPEARHLIVGGGDDVPFVERLIRNLGLQGKVLLAGAPPDGEMVNYYNLADVFVYPSKREGFPAIVLLEALASGKPVIGGNQPGAEEALLNGELGIVVDSDDTRAIAEAIIRVLRGDVPRHLLDPARLRARTLEAYGPEAYRAHVERFLDRLKTP